MNKAQRLDSEEWVEGYYFKNPFHHYIVVYDGLDSVIIKPETLQVQITSTGEWVNVDDTEVVVKNRKVNIKLEDWDNTCGDGCCNTYGTNTTVNNEDLFCQNQDRATIIEEVLTHLGFDAIVVEV